MVGWIDGMETGEGGREMECGSVCGGREGRPEAGMDDEEIWL